MNKKHIVLLGMVLVLCCTADLINGVINKLKGTKEEGLEQAFFFFFRENCKVYYEKQLAQLVRASRGNSSWSRVRIPYCFF